MANDQEAKEAQARAIKDHYDLAPACPHCQGELRTQEATPARQVCGSCGRVQPRAFRQMLLDDLAVLRLHLEDDLIHDTEAGEAFARVVGALDLTAEEETWLEEQ